LIESSNIMPGTRLSNQSLHKLSAGVVVPSYRRDEVSIGIVHLGLGNFHRAHQALYFEQILNRGDLRWGVCAVSLKRPVTRNALQPQDGLYSVLTRSSQATQVQVIGAIKEVLVAPENPGAVVKRLADVDTKLITLTITEKGYLERGEGSALGYLLEALKIRFVAQRPVTILSCDNLSTNGDRLHAQLIEQAQRQYPLLAAWISENVVCPNTMVDRIVPATLDSDRREAVSLLGLADAWPVAAEPFSQWVIEDRFATEKPEFEAVGVQLVASCQPFEEMKLRLLNAAHSAMAYLGAPAGFRTVDQAIACPEMRYFVQLLWKDARASLAPELQSQVSEYLVALEARFANPALGHRLEQIAMDGSLKVPLRFLDTLRDCVAGELPFEAILLAVAAWIRWLSCYDEAGQVFELKDPMSASLIELAGARASASVRVQQLMQFEPVFGLDLRHYPELVARLIRYLELLETKGSIATIVELQGGEPAGAG
jgi:fructuronate reductase